MKRSFLALAVLVLPLFGGSLVRGDIVTNSPNLPPLAGQYVTPTQAHQLYMAGALTIEVINIHHSGFSASFLPPQNVGDMGNDIFNSVLVGDMTVNGGPPSHFVGSAHVNVKVVKASGPNGSSLGTYNTEMLQLDVTGLPGGALIRESPTLASLGQTTESDAGGGLFRITSFFDIFTELSLDNGATWIPSTGSGHVDLVPNGPEPSSLITCSLGALVCIGTLGARRIRTSSSRGQA